MKNSILIVLSVMVFTTAHAQSPPPSLLATYANYLANASEENILETYWQYFSKGALTGVEVSSPKIKEQLLFNKLMRSTSSVYEAYFNNYGCLSVNGKDSNDEPITFNIEYEIDNSQALISHIDVQLHNSEKEFPIKATCPRDYMVF
ncbi:hypothetical protein [Vibrio campbellii]|uniref:Uncharacterized protein n=1 Tax=Vibrio campbellii TaxID=680 RepID=A0ACC7R5W4_9VIBR|nr:hypothetical protein [Vibrio campbellii]MCC8253320.1 hypothetical protein [Vibrio campbellii CAIM 333]MCE7731075.1 hypothetical protein [Vibrio campbellii]